MQTTEKRKAIYRWEENDRLTEVDSNAGADNRSIPKDMWANLPDEYIDKLENGETNSEGYIIENGQKEYLMGKRIKPTPMTIIWY